MKSIQDRALAYLARMPHSVAGQGGDFHAFKAALALTKGFALSPIDAYPLLAEWNARCLPPWTESELWHKLKSAAKSSSQPLGFLLGKRIAAGNERLVPDIENELEKKARQRKTWAAFNPLKPPGIRMIAQLRGIRPDAVDLAHRLGFLKGALFDGHKCFIIHEAHLLRPVVSMVSFSI